MYYAQMKVIGDPKQFIILVKKKYAKVEQKVRELGLLTTDIMKLNVTAGIKRPPATGNLAKSIKCHVFPELVGVGKINELPVYWYVVNYGKYFGGGNFIPWGEG